ncbi:MAG: DUF1016 family protein [Bacteroidetes bacterium]|nr:MAG: DUF1016 family protein [Bacteroidota bacterium]
MAKQKHTGLVKVQKGKTEQVTRHLFTEIRFLVEETRTRVAQAVNSNLVILNWNIGTLIRKNILDEERAEYGKKILHALSEQLIAEYGKGFTYSALSRMITFSRLFPNVKIVATLSQQFGWSHFIELITLENDLKRDFYTEMCRIERWSVRKLRNKIAGMLFERTAISKKPDNLIKQELKSLREEDRITADLVFKDPYFLDFLGLIWIQFTYLLT